MSKLKLTVNEEKTRICKVPQGEFDLLGFTFGRMYSVLLAQVRKKRPNFANAPPARVFASARNSDSGSPGSVQRATERADSEFESLATNGLRSNHGRAFSSCAASRNSVASSP
jgi:hypothetical protein